MHRDERGAAAVVLARCSFDDLLDVAIAQPRRFASSSPDVLLRIAQLPREVGWKVRDAEDEAIVREQAQRREDTAADAGLAEAETVELTKAVQRVHHALVGRW